MHCNVVAGQAVDAVLDALGAAAIFSCNGAEAGRGVLVMPYLVVGKSFLSLVIDISSALTKINTATFTLKALNSAKNLGVISAF